MSDTAINTVETIEVIDPESISFIRNMIRLAEESIAAGKAQKEYYREGLRGVEMSINKAERNKAFWERKLQRAQP